MRSPVKRAPFPDAIKELLALDFNKLREQYAQGTKIVPQRGTQANTISFVRSTQAILKKTIESMRKLTKHTDVHETFKYQKHVEQQIVPSTLQLIESANKIVTLNKVHITDAEKISSDSEKLERLVDTLKLHMRLSIDHHIILTALTELNAEADDETKNLNSIEAGLAYVLELLASFSPKAKDHCPQEVHKLYKLHSSADNKLATRRTQQDTELKTVDNKVEVESITEPKPFALVERSKISLNRLVLKPSDSKIDDLIANRKRVPSLRDIDERNKNKENQSVSKIMQPTAIEGYKVKKPLGDVSTISKHLSNISPQTRALNKRLTSTPRKGSKIKPPTDISRSLFKDSSHSHSHLSLSSPECSPMETPLTRKGQGRNFDPNESLNNVSELKIPRKRPLLR